MSRARIMIAGLIAVALLALLSWQLHRERLVKACLSSGGAWAMEFMTAVMTAARAANVVRGGRYTGAFCGRPPRFATRRTTCQRLTADGARQ